MIALVIALFQFAPESSVYLFLLFVLSIFVMLEYSSTV